MASSEAFSQAISHKPNLSVAMSVVLAAWFLEEENNSPTFLNDAVRFVEDNGIRFSVSNNLARTKSQMAKIPNTSISKQGQVRIGLKLRDKFRNEFGEFVAAPSIQIEELILDCDGFGRESKLIKKLCLEINATFQVHAFNACTVIMRRLMEVLIIRAFKKNGGTKEIEQTQGYLGLDKLITRVDMTSTFKLSRGVNSTMNTVKKIGDKGAHSTTYEVVEKDISNISTEYRAMIADLLAQ